MTSFPATYLHIKILAHGNRKTRQVISSCITYLSVKFFIPVYRITTTHNPKVRYPRISKPVHVALRGKSCYLFQTAQIHLWKYWKTKTQAGLSRKENCIKAINFHLMVFRIKYSFCSVELLRAKQRSGQNRFKLCLTFQNSIYFYPAGLWIYHWFHLQLVYIDMFTLIANNYSHM